MLPLLVLPLISSEYPSVPLFHLFAPFFTPLDCSGSAASSLSSSWGMPAGLAMLHQQQQQGEKKEKEKEKGEEAGKQSGDSKEGEKKDGKKEADAGKEGVKEKDQKQGKGGGLLSPPKGVTPLPFAPGSAPTGSMMHMAAAGGRHRDRGTRILRRGERDEDQEEKVWEEGT
ncbi:unnamed protein product [Closterium sp. NIES-53]